MANVRAVLDGINAGRTVLGGTLLEDLPRGTRSSSNSCPIARALRDLDPNVKVGQGEVRGLSSVKAFQFAAAVGGEVTEHNGTARIKIPEEWTQFINEFDSGRLSQYDEQRRSVY